MIQEEMKEALREWQLKSKKINDYTEEEEEKAAGCHFGTGSCQQLSMGISNSDCSWDFVEAELRLYSGHDVHAYNMYLSFEYSCELFVQVVFSFRPWLCPFSHGSKVTRLSFCSCFLISPPVLLLVSYGRYPTSSACEDIALGCI